MCINTLCVYKHPTISNWVLPTCPLHFFLSFFLLKFWLGWVIIVASLFLVYGILFTQPGPEPRPPASGAQSLIHWITREVSAYSISLPLPPLSFSLLSSLPPHTLDYHWRVLKDHSLKLGGHKTVGFEMLSWLPSPGSSVSLSGHPHWRLSFTIPVHQDGAPSTHTEPGTDGDQTNYSIS